MGAGMGCAFVFNITVHVFSFPIVSSCITQSRSWSRVKSARARITVGFPTLCISRERKKIDWLTGKRSGRHWRHGRVHAAADGGAGLEDRMQEVAHEAGQAVVQLVHGGAVARVWVRNYLQSLRFMRCDEHPS